MKYLLFALCFMSAMLQAQTCLTAINQTTPTESFVDNDDGTISDLRFGLTWMTCSLGQTWSEGVCNGDASQLNWQQALQAAHGFEYASKTGWRVPNVKELATINELQCVRPAINETLFPNTPSDDFWTSTPSVIDPERAWVVAFFNSSNSIKQKDLFVFVRLVRTSD